MDIPVSPVSPSSPNKANFSYPSRAPPPGVPRQVPGQPQQTPQQWGENWNAQQHGAYNDDNRPIPLRTGNSSQTSSPQIVEGQQQPRKQGTLTNLKAAAHGIHGAGEALRGTFNDTFDRRFTPADNAVHAKNRAIIDAGRSEIDSQQFAHHRPRPPAHDAPPVPPIPDSQQQTPYQGPAILGSQIEHGDRKGSGKLSGFMKKMKEGPMASDRSRAVNT